MYPIIQEGQNVVLTECYFTMPDGVELYTRIAAPKGKDKHPIVFMRDPYEQAHNGEPHDISTYENDLFITHGYAVVYQHCRGCGDSKGVFRAYEERDDGVFTLEQIRKLPFYCGEIYVTGRSYKATVHYTYLGDNFPDIKGAVMEIQSDSVYYNRYHNGCNMGFGSVDWWGKRKLRACPNQNWNGVLKRPFKDIAKRIFGKDDPTYTKMLMHPQFDESWNNDRRYCADNMKVPTLFVEGWFDFYVNGMFSMWHRLPEKTRQKSAFVVGPWGHDTKVHPQSPYSTVNGSLPEDHIVEWFDSIRNGTEYPYADVGNVTYYAIGENKWRYTETPFFKQSEKKLYFRPDRTAGYTYNKKGEISYTYDPDRDLDEQGCVKLVEVDVIKNAGLRTFPYPDKDDVIVFETEPALEALPIFGRPHWQMKVRSDCEDTAFYIRLYLVEDGVCYNLTDTMVQLAMFAPDYCPSDEVLIDIELPHMAVTLMPEHRLRIDIASRGGTFIPHANVKGHWAEVTETRIAHNTLILDNNSTLTLPIADNPHSARL